MSPPRRPRRPSSAETIDRLLVGLGAFAAGAAAGVLRAPREGASTRRQLTLGVRSAAFDAGAHVSAVTDPVAAGLGAHAEDAALRTLWLAGDWDIVEDPELLRDLREGRV
jgi:hypothetical protein